MFKKLNGALVGLTLLGMGGMAKASLIGDEIFASGLTLGPASATVGPGVEFVGINDLVNFDFDANTLTLTPNPSVGWSGFGDYIFSDLDWVDFPVGEIIGLSIISAVGTVGTLLVNFSFTADSITLDMQGGGMDVGASVVYGIETSHTVPEPSTLALFGIGLAGLGFMTRRRRNRRRQN